VGEGAHWPRHLVAGTVVIAAAATIAPAAIAARRHALKAVYSGHGHGQVSGSKASGSATLTGRGTPVGPGTLSGSASGAFVSQTCVEFSGVGVLKGKTGSMTLRAQGAQACAAGNANTVTFAGTAKVVGGTATFKGAHGTVSFDGIYLRDTEAVTITLKGEITY
jgi:hypothetical protein